MKKLCVISMLILGIVGNAFCQKSGEDTLLIFEGKSPLITNNLYDRLASYTWNTKVKRNPNHIIVDFGNKNILKIDYQGSDAFVVKQNVDTLIADFWNDYSLIQDTLNKKMVKKITYYAKNKDAHSKSVIEIQYYPQKEVFQFGKDIELVQLKQDTLLFIAYEMQSNSNHYSNRPVKRFKNQSFLFNLNSIDDIEEIMGLGVNQAIVEAGQRVENERKTTKIWKSVTVENNTLNQKIRSRIGGGRLYNYSNLHADLGVGMLKNKFVYSSTVAMDIMSESYFLKGITFGFQYNTHFDDNNQVKLSGNIFAGMTYYKRTKYIEVFRGGIFIGYSPNTNEVALEKIANLKLFGWYQLTQYIRIQPELSLFEINRTAKKTTFYPYNTGFKISFGI